MKQISIIILVFAIFSLALRESFAVESEDSTSDQNDELRKNFMMLFDAQTKPIPATEIVELAKQVTSSNIGSYEQEYIWADEILSMISHMVMCSSTNIRVFIETWKKIEKKPAFEHYLAWVREKKVKECIDMIATEIEASESEIMFHRDLRQIRSNLLDMISNGPDGFNVTKKIGKPLYSLVSEKRFQDALLPYLITKLEARRVDLYDSKALMSFIEEDLNRLREDTRPIIEYIWDGAKILPSLEIIDLNSIIVAPDKIQKFLVDLKIMELFAQGRMFIREMADLIQLTNRNYKAKSISYSNESFQNLLKIFRDMLNSNDATSESWENVWLLTRSVLISSESSVLHDGQVVSLIGSATKLYSLSQVEERTFQSEDVKRVVDDLNQFVDKPALKKYIEKCVRNYVARGVGKISSDLRISMNTVTGYYLDIDAVIKECVSQLDSVRTTHDQPHYKLLTEEILIRAIASIIVREEIDKVRAAVETLRSECLTSLKYIEEDSSGLPYLESINLDEIRRAGDYIRDSLIFAKITKLFANEVDYEHLNSVIEGIGKH